MQPVEILAKFAEFIDYEKLKEQKAFNMLSCEYEFKRIGEKIENLVKFDPSGSLAVMFAASEFERVMKNAKISVLDLLKNPNGLDEEIKMYHLFTSSEIEDIKDKYINDIDKIIRQSVNLVGERDIIKEKEVLLDNVVHLAENIRKLNLDVYLKTDKIYPTLNILPEILVFDTTSEAVLHFENVKDGVYLSYINNNFSADGYFAVFIKSNGNLISFNDRASESYKGQHNNSRSGRWAEAHSDIFPYDYIFEYGDYDYKGYATSYRIDKSKLAFLNQEPDVYIPLIILMVTLGRNLSNDVLEGPIKYIDALTDIPLLSGSTTALTTTNNSLVLKNTKSLNLEFETEKIIDGSYGEEFGSFMRQNEEAKFFIERYGKDFIPNTTDIITSGTEMIANEESLRKEMYRLLRLQLRNHVARKMEKVYSDAGKKEGIKSEYTNLILNHKEKIIDILARAYAGLPIKEFEQLNYNAEKRTCDAVRRASAFSNEDARDVIFQITDKNPAYCTILNERHPSSKNIYDGKLACPVTGAIPSIWVTFRFQDWLQLEALLGEEVPEFLKGYRTTRLYNGNSILNATDPCNELHNPVGLEQCVVYDKAGIAGYGYDDYFFKERKYHSTTVYIGEISVGFSKRGIKKILETLKES